MGSEPLLPRVLVVDDDPLVARAHARVLRKISAVTWCTSFDEALGLLEGRAFDLVLTDLDLGDKSGLALLDVVAGKWPWVRRILCSGATPRGSADRARGTAEHFLEKPLDIAMLRALVLGERD